MLKAPTSAFDPKRTWAAQFSVRTSSHNDPLHGANPKRDLREALQVMPFEKLVALGSIRTHGCAELAQR
jgi:hypothetical protein